jgi:AcrR family transcriptional regulator
MTTSCQVCLVPRSTVARRREATREGLLAAALHCFSRDGYRRTAMERVAREAGVSRAALYLHFDSKEALFRALVAGLHERALDQARAAAGGQGDLAARLTAMLEAKTADFFDLLRSSPHAEEFLDENHRLCGDLSTEAAAKHARLLTRVLAAAERGGEIALARTGLGAARATDLLLATAEGIKSRGRATLTTAEYRSRLAEAVRVVVAGLGGARLAPR